MAGKFSIVSSVVVLALVSVASADIMTFTPTPADAWDLDHGWAYGWGIDVPLETGEEVVAATLTFNNIRNWNNSANILYLQLMDGHDLGLTRYRDNTGAGNYFDGAGELMTTYENLPSTAQTIAYDFSSSDLAALNSYLADGHFGMGFDPDCHFYNDGITLTMTTVPEPGTFVLLIAGAASVFTARRRR